MLIFVYGFDTTLDSKEINKSIIFLHGLWWCHNFVSLQISVKKHNNLGIIFASNKKIH